MEERMSKTLNWELVEPKSLEAKKSPAGPTDQLRTTRPQSILELEEGLQLQAREKIS
jgi:hypothetical protein